jgi:hypothetical protein
MRSPSPLRRQSLPSTKCRSCQRSWSLGTDGAALLKLHGKRAKAPVVGRCFAAANLCHSNLSRFRPVTWAAWRRLFVPAFGARGQGCKRSAGSSPSPEASSARGPSHKPLGCQRSGAGSVRHQECWLTLHSSGTSTGLALGPRTGQCHHPLRGPSAIPVPAPQLKR